MLNPKQKDRFILLWLEWGLKPLEAVLYHKASGQYTMCEWKYKHMFHLPLFV